MVAKVCPKIIREVERVFLNQKQKNKKSLYKPSKKKPFKSKIKEIIKILHDSKIKRDRKIEVIEKILYEPRE